MWRHTNFMRSKRFTKFSSWLLVLPLVTSSFVASAQQGRRAGVPQTRIANVAEDFHGTAVNDPYRWLEDQKAPETRAWIDEQNRHTQSVLGSLAGRDRIRQRLGELLRIDTIGQPTVRGDRYFFSKRRAAQNQPVVYMRRGLKGQDEVLLDPNTMSADQRTSVSLMEVSEDGKMIIYGVRQGGADEVEVRFMDTDTKRDLADRMPTARYFGMDMTPDKTGVYYTRFQIPQGSRVYYHRLGTDVASDKELFGEGYTATQIVSPSLSEDGRYLFYYVSYGSSGKNEIFYQNLAENSPIKPLATGVDARFGGQAVGDRFFMFTTHEAPNGRIVEVGLKNPQMANWRNLIPQRDNATINSMSLAGGKIFVSYLEDVVTRIRMFDDAGKQQREISFPTLGTAGNINGRWNRDEAFYSFSSYGQPATIYRYQVSSGKQEVWARINVPVRSEEIETKQVFFASKDGTRVPMFLVYKKGLQLDGNRPVLLYGYGGFNSSLTPGFSATAAFWAEQGGVYAVANLRGGGEYGEAWHKAAMFERKQNTFDDFIAASEWLIQNKFTNPSRLAISGGSNGGLLVGAALTQRPDLYQAVICSYPLLDMLRYHNFLVARFWTTEYGSSEDPKQFEYIRRYSPYHNVKKGEKYPAVMFITGDADTRVDPLHARKMAALLQASTASDRPVLLHYDTKAGHSGGTPVNKQIEDLTDSMSFLLWQLGAMKN